MIQTFFKAITKKQDLDFVDFIDQHFFLPTENSAKSGKFRPYKYQKQIIEMLDNDFISEIHFKKSTRIGYTTILKAYLCYLITQKPSAIRLYLPSENDCDEFIKEQWSPLEQNIEILRDKLILEKDTRKQTAKLKVFPGGNFDIVNGSIFRKYGSATKKVIIFDEIDKFPLNVQGKGDPLKLGRRRGVTFHDYKLLNGCNPTIDGKSQIDNIYRKTDKRRYFIPCPHCNNLDVIEFKNLIWDKDKNGNHLISTVRLQCQKCNGYIYPDQKYALIEHELAGFRQTKSFACCGLKQNPIEMKNWDQDGLAICYKCGKLANYNDTTRIVVGVHINSLYSLERDGEWTLIVSEFLDSYKQPDLLRVFYNDILGDTFKDDVNKITEHDLAKFVTSLNTLEPKIIIMSVDVQIDRLEYDIRAYDEYDGSWGVKNGIICNDPQKLETYDALMEVFNTPLAIGNGSYNIDYGCIDVGSPNATLTRKFVLGVDQFIGVKGEAKADDNISFSRLSTNLDYVNSKGHKKLLLINVNTVKDHIFHQFTKKDKDSVSNIYFSSFYNEEYYKQITSEEKSYSKDKNGKLKRTWVKNRDRNEGLDLLVYNIALYHHIAGFISR